MNSFRWQAISERAGRYPYDKHAMKLRPEDWALMRELCIADAGLSVSAFELKANRLFLDQLKKPRGWVTICGLLCAGNTALLYHFKDTPACDGCLECKARSTESL